MKTTTLAVFIAAALAAGPCLAAEPTTSPAQQQAVQAEIDTLVKRIQVLSKQLAGDTDVRVVVRRIEGDAPEAMRWGGNHAGFRSGPGLGIVMSANPAAAGVRIAAVTPDSPAMKSGLHSGDVLLSVDGKAIHGNGDGAIDSARELLGDLKQGQVVKLRYARQGHAYDADVRADAIRRVMVFNRDGEAPMAPRARMDGRMTGHPDSMLMPPGVEMEIERIGPMHDCKPGSGDCGLPSLFQAFRWQGLNLASIDASLGRYFGTDNGVLVLSTGPELKSLQSGDVIRRVAGAEVDSPRDVMRTLREKESGSQLRLDVLRDHKPIALTITVPRSRPLPFMAPPQPPAPPRLPGAPMPARAAPPAPAPPPPAR